MRRDAVQAAWRSLEATAKGPAKAPMVAPTAEGVPTVGIINPKPTEVNSGRTSGIFVSQIRQKNRSHREDHFGTKIFAKSPRKCLEIALDLIR